MYSISDLRKGLKIELEREPFEIVECHHIKPGKGATFVRTRLKSFLTGQVLERTFKAADKIEKPDFQQKDMQFLYADGSNYVFMDQTTYEQIAVPSDVVGENVNYLKENMVIGILLFNGKAAGLELPTFVELRVKETMPGVKGDTASNTTKPATLETGAVVNVPLFIGNDELIKVDTRTGSYAERVKR